MVFFVLPPQAPPKEGMSLTLLTCFHSFQTISNMFLCFTMSSKPMSLKNMSLSLCLNPMLLSPHVRMLLCLQNLCSSVSHKSPTPVRRTPLCRRGAGGEAVPRKRENQINTLVLKDINFTINIIELSYYRTIETLNQP